MLCAHGRLQDIFLKKGINIASPKNLFVFLVKAKGKNGKLFSAFETKTSFYKKKTKVKKIVDFLRARVKRVNLFQVVDILGQLLFCVCCEH